VTAPVVRARQLLALATDAAASPDEQRTAAHALAKLLREHALGIVEGVSVKETADKSKRRGRRSAEEGESPQTGRVREGARGVKATDWCVYIAVGYAFCQGCGQAVHEGEAFYTHARIGLRCTGCYHVHGVRL
jgi:hypothetical protein